VGLKLLLDVRFIVLLGIGEFVELLLLVVRLGLFMVLFPIFEPLLTVLLLLVFGLFWT
jgi:hypothetical protein